MPTLPPLAESALNSWAANFDQRINADPESYGLSPEQAAQFTAAAGIFQTALALAITPATRTIGTVARKNEAKKIVRRLAARLIKRISATFTVSDEARLDLGLNVKNAPTAIPAPATRPQLVVRPDGTIRLFDESVPSRRGKPPGVQGAAIFTAILPHTAPAPRGLDEVRLALLATRSRFQLPIPPAADTLKLYVLARWYNERGEMGPISTLASTTIAA